MTGCSANEEKLFGTLSIISQFTAKQKPMCTSSKCTSYIIFASDNVFSFAFSFLP